MNLSTVLKLLLELGSSIGAVGTDIQTFVNNVKNDKTAEGYLRDGAQALVSIGNQILTALGPPTNTD
jgi:hypothetical protein